MRPNRMGIGLKFSLAVTLLIIMTMSGVATLIINYQKESLRDNTLKNNLEMARNLAHDAVEPLLMFDPLRLDELVQTMLAAGSCAYALIVDREGKIVAHTSRGRIGGSLDNKDYEALLRNMGPQGELVREYVYDREPVKEFTVPIHIRDEVLGIATVAYSTEKINAAIETRLRNLKRYISIITGIMLLAGIAGAFVVSSFLTRPIKRLKTRMLDVQAGRLDVEVENPKIRRCWERLVCERTDCPAYGRLRCWAIAGTFCHGKVQGTFAQKIGDCRKCVVYIESCGDEIHELIEVFNQMVRDLRYNLGELEKAQAEKSRLERLSALGEMGTTVAHEIKNPLNSIRLAASYLKKNFHGKILEEFLSIIEEEVRRLDDITTAFLGFSRPAPLNLRPCDINAIVRPTVELIRQEAMDRNIEVVVLTDEHIPPVRCDYARIRQALMNLLVNALDASREGDTITVTTERENSAVRLSVQDTGKGISQEELDKIFKPFYTTKARGSGLGLAVVDRITKEHGGIVEVKSAPGKGATFTMVLPLHE